MFGNSWLGAPLPPRALSTFPGHKSKVDSSQSDEHSGKFMTCQDLVRLGGESIPFAWGSPQGARFVALASLYLHLQRNLYRRNVGGIVRSLLTEGWLVKPS